MSQTTENTAKCLVCEQTSQDVPLVKFEFRGAELSICPQHLPLLIHNPARLADKLPGAEDLQGAQGH
ncbi:hypothetical protein ACFLYO_02640 [Chloroflexota bacterium]